MIERREPPSAPTSAKVFSQVKKASLEALRLRLPDPLAKQLVRHWSELLRDLGLPKRERARLAVADLASLSKNLQAMDFRSFRKELLSLGENLARQKVEIHDGIALIESLSEDYLSSLRASGRSTRTRPEGRPRRTELALAVARLCFLAARILAAGYSHQLEEERRLLASRSRGADESLHRTSSLLSRVYERERYQISRQLHEKLGHYLVGLKLHLDTLSRAVSEGGAEGSSNEVEESMALVDEAIRSVRRMVLDLGPAVVKEVGLIPAVRMYARQFSGRSWIDVTVEAEDLPEDLPLLVQVALYRLSQQVLDFCQRSRAQSVRMSFKGRKDSIVVVADEDDVPVDAVRKSVEESWAILRERAELLGAVLHRTPRDVGTRIELVVPSRSLGKTAAGPFGKTRMPPKAATSPRLTAGAYPKVN
jgi:signal transduction histidine kinase